MPALTNPRHERFARQYIRTDFNAAEAYRRAFPGCKGNACAKAAGWRLLRTNRKVASRVKELRRNMSKRADITENKILSDYQDALEMARVLGKPADMISAATAQAKLVGLLRDRIEAGGPGAFENMDDIGEILNAVEASQGRDVANALSLAFGLGERPGEEKNEPTENVGSLADISPASDAVN